MTTPISTFPIYPLYENAHVVGPVRLFRAPYVSAGANPTAGNMVSMGDLSNDGIELDHKVTYGMSDIQQLMFSLRAHMTKQEIDLKFTLLHMQPAVWKYALGLPNDNVVRVAPTVGVQGTNEISFGEPFDVLSAAPVPSVEPQYAAWIFQFPTPNFNFQTTPKGQCAYFHFYKAAVISHGAMKFSKSGEATTQVTLKAFADISATGPNYIGKAFTYEPAL